MPPPPPNPTLLVPLKRAFISVFDKTDVVDTAQHLSTYGIDIVSTGGTHRALTQGGIAAQDVQTITAFPEILDGRVKTLHPRVFAGVLAVHDNPAHQKTLLDHALPTFDLVLVNLYPFETKAAAAAMIPYTECIESIDIGGPALLRAAAKNHRFVTVITDACDYAALQDELATHNGHTTYAFRQRMAAVAFARTAAYDAVIADWLHKQAHTDSTTNVLPRRSTLALTSGAALRYGENPQQTAAVYQTPAHPRTGALGATLVQGKPLSYNNMGDADAAFELIAEFPPETPHIAIIKHANPCGVATGRTLRAAYDAAFACDSVSAFGGVVACNQTIDADAAMAITAIFTEVVIAPDATPKARSVFAKNKNLRLLLTGGLPPMQSGDLCYKHIAGGMLVQSRDRFAPLQDGWCDDWRVVSERQPTKQEKRDMVFAYRVVKHVTSNAIVYAQGGCTVGIGAGQTSRLDSARIAVDKARAQQATPATPAKEHIDRPILTGAVMASDAFFPFPDALLVGINAGVRAVIQPGGSRADATVINQANTCGVAMVLTGQRHFRH